MLLECSGRFWFSLNIDHWNMNSECLLKPSCPPRTVVAPLKMTASVTPEHFWASSNTVGLDMISQSAWSLHVNLIGSAVYCMHAPFLICSWTLVWQAYKGRAVKNWDQTDVIDYCHWLLSFSDSYQTCILHTHSWRCTERARDNSSISAGLLSIAWVDCWSPLMKPPDGLLSLRYNNFYWCLNGEVVDYCFDHICTDSWISSWGGWNLFSILAHSEAWMLIYIKEKVTPLIHDGFLW